MRQRDLSGTVPFENEQRALGKDGKYRWFLVQYNPMLDETGRVIRWYATGTDSEGRRQVPAEYHSDKPKGTVIVEFGINENGTVDWARVERSWNKEMDSKALAGVSRWVFKPATKKGIAVPVKLDMEVNFRLTSEGSSHHE